MRALPLLAVLLLAGCTAPVAPDADLHETPPARPAVLELAATNALEGDGFEPSVEVAPDGTIYVTAAQGIVVPTFPASRLWVSRDNGTTFEAVDPIDPESGASNLPAGAEGDLAIAQDGTAYYVDLTETANVPVARSMDRGQTWELRSPAAFAVPGGDREWVAAGPGQSVAVAWNQLAGVALGPAPSLWVAVSQDGGRTFPVQTPVTQAGDSAMGGIDMDPEGRIVLGRTAGGVSAFVSSDGGRTFAQSWIREDAPTVLFAVPAADAAGNLYMAWVERLGNTTEAFYSWSADHGATWSDPFQVSSHGGATVFAWIDASEAGHVAVAYLGSPGQPGDPGEVRGGWRVHAADIRNATGTPDIARGVLSDEVSADVVCTSGLSCESGRQLGDYLQVALGPDGAVHVAYSDEGQAVHWVRGQRA